MSDRPEQERPRTALVLDDEAHIGAIVCKVLQMTGVTAGQFTEPISFLAEVKRSQPQLIVVDLALGQSDAIEVIRKLEVLKFPGLVLLISGRDEATLAEIERIGRSHGLRMLPSLRKPFRAAALKAALEAPAKFDSPGPQQPDSPPRPRPQNVNLQEALRQHWLEVWYQPKVDLRSQAICGAEALIRARHPHYGIIGPVDLLPPASDPLYRPLSLFVVQRAIADWKAFCDAGHSLKLAVNMPASVLNAPGFVDAVRNLIPTGSDFPGLIVEVTEDEIIRDPNWIHEVAMQLRLCNVALSIDDFGSAYASLSRLKDLPFREIKLDRSFVSGCAGDPLKRSLCQTVVDLARRFGAAACGEGVETLEEGRCLVELGFDTAQGYYFAKPMPRNDFLEFLSKRQHEPGWGLKLDAQARTAAQA
jgi:EAL domain-containing protein (putative c-di-GMP-specific phosphodiesterase class I)/ActR/RegA family two-component response regulator